MSAFDRLAPFIQEYIYQSGWNELRDVQEDAIHAILDTPGHVLITSGTASGKTEAALFPILTDLDAHPSASFGVLYIGPLKALINDQFERVTDLLDETRTPVYAWHGDRSATEKARAARDPKGILQITPEALEALMMNHADQARAMFADLRYVVIDELHAFMGTDRGLQLQCLLTRLDRLTGRAARRVGLSATIRDAEAAGQWLAAGTELGTTVVASAAGGRRLNLSLRHDAFPMDMESPACLLQREARMDYLYRQVAGRKCLVFADSRMEAESVAASLSGLAAKRGEPDIYRVHHGSISAALRAEAESALRDGDQPAVAVATKTLELGIDLGSLDRVVQLGAPSTCSSFVQRLGRTGRRGSPAVMRFLTAHEIGARPMDELPWEMLQTIAIIQLYLEEKWVEDFENKPLPYSLLFHQTLSCLMAGERTGRELARAILPLPPFRHVDPADYRLLLDHMLKTGMIEKTESGRLIVGLAGEKLTGNYRFYSVFAEQGGYRVLHGQQLLGEIDEPPGRGKIIQLAGRAWRVDEVDEGRKCVFVTPASGEGERQWQGNKAPVDDRIVLKMRDVLLGEAEYAYLQPEALQALRDARLAARAYQIDQSCTIVDHQLLVFHPWVGTRKLRTFEFLLRTVLRDRLCPPNGLVLDPVGFALRVDDARTWLGRLKREIGRITLDELIPLAPTLPADRYDAHLPEELRRKSYVYNQLDLDGVKRWATD